MVSTPRRVRAAGLGSRLAGMLLVALPFLPLAGWIERQSGRTAGLVPPTEWLLGLLVFGTGAWLLAVLLAWVRPGGWTGGLRGPAPGHDARLLGACLAALVGLLVVVTVGAYAGRPLLIDSIAQLFQAELFAAGEVKVLPPGPAEFFMIQQVVPGAEGWYAQYPPGHALLLTLGAKLGASWVTPVLLSLGTAVAIFLFARAAFGASVARLTLVLVVASPFFWFMGASHMNHVTALFFVAVASWLLAEGERRASASEGGGARRLVAGSAALGAAFLVRPLTAVAVLAVLLPAVALPLLRRRRTRLVASMLAAAAAVGSLLLLYNHATTGHPLRLGYTELWGAGHGLGFHETPWGETHTPLRGVAQELADLSLLNQALFEWPIPALLPIGLLFALGGGRSPWARRSLAAFLVLPAAYLFYWHRDTYLGPRFLYSSLVFVLPLTAHGLLEGWRWAERRTVGRAGSALGVPARSLIAVLLVLCIGYMALYAGPRRFAERAGGNRTLKVDLAEEAARAGIDEGIVFVAVSWGNRTLSRLRAHAVSASLAERAYRQVDHCRLHELADAADAGRLQRGDLRRALEREIQQTGVLARPYLNGDPSLRVDPSTPLTPECRAEIAHDRRGYTVYAPHLTANRPGFGGPLLFVRDLGPGNARLLAMYPGRPGYLYRPGEFSRLPEEGASPRGTAMTGSEGRPR